MTSHERCCFNRGRGRTVAAESRVAGPPLLWIVLPLAVLGAAIWWLWAANPLSAFNNGAPPVENLTFERTILDTDGLRVLVRAGGSEPMTIAQVQVDDAYWQFTQEPAGPLERGASAWIRVPFPWVLGEAHAVNIVTNTGATFEHEIPVAVATPAASSGSLLSQAMLGAFVGILPVAVGLMFYPALRGVGRNGMDFLLALTVGLLAFLFVDAFEDALELAGEAAAIFQGTTMVVLAAIASFLLLMAVARRHGAPTGLGTGDLHRAWHRPAQSRRGAGDRRGFRDGRGRPRHASWCSASRCTTSPKASALPRRS